MHRASYNNEILGKCLLRHGCHFCQQNRRPEKLKYRCLAVYIFGADPRNPLIADGKSTSRMDIPEGVEKILAQLRIPNSKLEEIR